MTELLNTEILRISELMNDSLLCLTESYKKNDAFINEMMDLTDSMQYSLLAGGKRIRPLLVFSFSELCGNDKFSALPFAQAIEMIHTYSLIHDDLPCMDNDDFRRGKPTNHKVFGDSTAVLAGDALLTEAFLVIAGSNFSDNIKVRAINILASRAGALGMVGGQIIDLSSENKIISQDVLRSLQRKKTGMLIEASCLLGCISAGCDDESILSSVSAFAHSLGLAFQITDDILDVTGSSEELGKNVGSDLKENKSTFVSILGIEEAKKEAFNQIELAKNELKLTFGKEKTLLLCDLCDYILERKK